MKYELSIISKKLYDGYILSAGDLRGIAQAVYVEAHGKYHPWPTHEANGQPNTVKKMVKKRGERYYVDVSPIDFAKLKFQDLQD